MCVMLVRCFQRLLYKFPLLSLLLLKAETLSYNEVHKLLCTYHFTITPPLLFWWWSVVFFHRSEKAWSEHLNLGSLSTSSVPNRPFFFWGGGGGSVDVLTLVKTNILAPIQFFTVPSAIQWEARGSTRGETSKRTKPGKVQFCF